jgi:hypothetical protein
VQIVWWLSKLLGVVCLRIKEVPECLARTTLSSSKPSQRDFGALHKCRKWSDNEPMILPTCRCPGTTPLEINGPSSQPQRESDTRRETDDVETKASASNSTRTVRARPCFPRALSLPSSKPPLFLFSWVLKPRNLVLVRFRMWTHLPCILVVSNIDVFRQILILDIFISVINNMN